MATLIHQLGMSANVAALEASSIQWNVDTRTIVHELLGSISPDFTFRPRGLRRGTLTYILPDKESADTAMSIHTQPGRIVVDEPGVVNLRYRAVGELRLAQDPVSRKAWILTTDFVEVYAT
ncbi:hypothetical protein ASF48_06975 [Rathayibacter sp. Leaf299]|uniref:hypothetical protein n=1 Tax=Rathayibacter sp. Leaf299 TaxID=1736328 RepID=UPI0006F21393|nr:hypothetical protein [Rathayibacter sp. Leaf299]KQQ22873.1 hypothetical protein ASF48_06975 [Rathayibacter sp. Leaf299]